jgi:hypothetical protein
MVTGVQGSRARTWNFLSPKRQQWQLRERMGLAEEYQVDTTIAMYPSKAEQLAERLLRRSDLQLGGQGTMVLFRAV